MPLVASLEEAIAELAPDVVLDLSDEPVLGPPARFRLAARALALGVPYEGADFRLDPPRFEAIATPSIAVIGTGKRVGKTAVTGHVASELARDRSVVVVAMGRGGPARAGARRGRGRRSPICSALSRAGRHAASDHLETAALTGVPTVGCRRCGGGLAGAVGISNVARRRPPRGGARPRPHRARRERRRAAADRRRSAHPRRRRAPGPRRSRPAT